MYNALVSWCEQNPSDIDRWIYKDEWETYFKENPKAKEAPKRTNKPKTKVNKTEQNPVQVVKPHFNFVTSPISAMSCEQKTFPTPYIFITVSYSGS